MSQPERALMSRFERALVSQPEQALMSQPEQALMSRTAQGSAVWLRFVQQPVACQRTAWRLTEMSWPVQALMLRRELVLVSQPGQALELPVKHPLCRSSPVRG